MPGSVPPEPYVPECLLDLIDEATLEYLITGFRETLRTGVTLYCKKPDGPPQRVDPDREDPISRQKYWSQVCREFRSTKEGDDACCKFDEQVTTEFLDNKLMEPRAHTCGGLGLTEMAVQIVVLGKPLGVVIAGQRLHPGEEAHTKIRDRIRTVCPERASDVEAALDLDYENQDVPSAFSPVCNEEGIQQLLKNLESFANLVGAICERVAQREVEVRRLEFLEYWNNTLSFAIPTHLTAWAHALQRCLASFWKFVNPSIERIGLFHGHQTGDTIRYSLVAMNSTKWWRTETFNLRTDDLKEPTPYLPGDLPQAMRLGVGVNIANTKHFHVYPFHQKNKIHTDELFSLVIIQTKDGFASNIQDFFRRFCWDLCRRDATTRLFIRQLETTKDFQQHVLEKRHDLKTSVQHIVGSTERLVRKMRRGVLPDSEEGRNLLGRIEWSVEDHCVQIEDLRGEPKEARHVRLESVDLFAVIREQAYLYGPVAENQRVTIDCGFLPEDGARILCEAAELKRAIAAILQNAIKYSYNDDRTVGVNGEVANDHVEFWIENYGIGIPPDMLETIKERSTRAAIPDIAVHREGTGIGLAIAAYVFVDLLGGSLDITSAASKEVTGPTDDYHRYTTRVKVTLPLMKED